MRSLGNERSLRRYESARGIKLFFYHFGKRQFTAASAFMKRAHRLGPGAEIIIWASRGLFFQTSHWFSSFLRREQGGKILKGCGDGPDLSGGQHHRYVESHSENRAYHQPFVQVTCHTQIGLCSFNAAPAIVTQSGGGSGSIRVRA